MGVLDSVHEPADLRLLDQEQLTCLAAELRDFLVSSVCETGGHLGPNLGVVELTLALHRVFDSPRVPLVFDVGHQAYVHKLLTGRRDGFARLRKRGGLSGYPNRAESPHDLVENSHASTALAYADGLSKAFAARGAPEREVVAVVGDGALTGGLAWEALNNLGTSQARVVVVLNDNARSYAPTVGGLADHLGRLAERAGYADLARRLGPAGAAGTARRDEGTVRAAGLFTELGLDYVGPVDGHDIPAVEAALAEARARARPVVVHCLTRKGLGYPPAEQDLADHLHTVGSVQVATGRPEHAPSRTWTDAFADALVALGGQREDLVGVSAAMLGPTGLQHFADAFPGRCFDVGIAEQQAVTSAAGLAMGGMHPVVALYATFANRAFDQQLLDVGLHRLPVTMVLDRAGVTGPDGASHHGMWDLAMLGMVPGMRVAAPRDAQTLAEELTEAVDCDQPTALRFPKAPVGPAVPAVARTHGVDVLHEVDDPAVLVVAAGALAPAALEAARGLAQEGVGCTVVDPRWLLPAPAYLSTLAQRHRLVLTAEDGVREGGVGARVAMRLTDDGVDTPVRCLGLPTEFLPPGTRGQLLARYGLDGAGLVSAARRALDQLPGSRRLRLVPGGGARR